jgi:hypothetical protein
MADQFNGIDTRSEILRIVGQVSQISDDDGCGGAESRKIGALKRT